MKYFGRIAFCTVAISTLLFFYRPHVKRTVKRIWRPQINQKALADRLNTCSFSQLNGTDDLLIRIQNPTYDCKNWSEFGGKFFGKKKKKNAKKDGQKWICLDQKNNVNPENCVVYSFGINNEWSFDDSIAKYGCNVYAFDPTMKAVDHQRSPKIAFYSLGISDGTGTMEMHGKECQVARLEDIRKKLGHETTKVDYLKVDIEGSEKQMIDDLWKTSPQILTDYVGQIGIEIHVGTSKENAFSLHSKYWDLINKLSCLGFELAHYEPNLVAKGVYFTAAETQYRCCYELVWVNQKLLL